MEIDECLQVARRLEQSGAHALVLSGGFVSKAPMYVMRGEMPIRTMDALHDAVVAEVRRAHGGQVDDSHRPLQGSLLPDDALRFRQELKMPLVYVGGLVARKKIDRCWIAVSRRCRWAAPCSTTPASSTACATRTCARCGCRHSNYCIARMYTLDMACHQRLQEPLPKALAREIEEIEKRQATDGEFFATSARPVAFLRSDGGMAYRNLPCWLRRHGYAVSKTHVRGMKVINALVVFNLFFTGGLIPQYMLYQDLGLLRSYWVMVIPGALNITYFVIMRNYFTYSVPKELEEAARLDGCTDVGLFFRIVMPVSKAMVAAVTLFIAVINWNDYYNYMMFIGNKTELQPFAWILRRMLVDQSMMNTVRNGAASLGLQTPPPMALRMATIICAMVPILCVYPFLQKYFTSGITLGAVKE